MAGLVPAIDAFLVSLKQDVDARHAAGHDEFSEIPLFYERSGLKQRTRIRFGLITEIREAQT